jgi:sugar lactone lactonase YvrE
LSNQRTVRSRSRLNGIAVDSQANVYLSGDGGMGAINADGEEVASLSTEDPVVNFAFGGDGGKTLFFTTRNGMGWVNTRVRGAECNGLGK